MRYARVAIVLLFAIPALGDQSVSHVRFNVTKVSSSRLSDGPISTKYLVEGYDAETETTYRGECSDVVYFDKQGKAAMHAICVVPQARHEYDVMMFPTAFMFPCDTPDGKCPGGDPNVTHYAYSAYTITDEQEKSKHK